VNSELYTAYSGMRAQLDALDVLANNLANANTTGFKEDRAFFEMFNQSVNGSNEGDPVGKAIKSSVKANKALNSSEGAMSFTNGDLDLAISGDGFLVVNAPQGIRYTRNGNLHLNAQSVLTTADGFPVLGASGSPITLGQGQIHISEEGGVSLNNTPVDRLKIVAFDNVSMLEKEGNSLLLSRAGQSAEKPSSAAIKSGYLEQSNVNPVSSLVQMVELLRNFESIQKSVSLVMNDMNSKAIDKLGS